MVVRPEHYDDYLTNFDCRVRTESYTADDRLTDSAERRVTRIKVNVYDRSVSLFMFSAISI